MFIAIGIFIGCDDFAEINTDPNVGVPPAEFLFTKVEKDIAAYKIGAETYHENHQKYTWTQYLTQGISNGAGFETILPGNKYEQFYGTIMPHLDEMRLIMSNLPEGEQKARQKLVAAADIVQAFSALRVTDQVGDMPYSEAGGGRHEGKLVPVYDKQEDVLNTLVSELDNAIAKLSETLTNEIGFQQACEPPRVFLALLPVSVLCNLHYPQLQEPCFVEAFQIDLLLHLLIYFLSSTAFSSLYQLHAHGTRAKHNGNKVFGHSFWDSSFWSGGEPTPQFLLDNIGTQTSTWSCSEVKFNRTFVFLYYSNYLFHSAR